LSISLINLANAALSKEKELPDQLILSLSKEIQIESAWE
jgi:hypothetical protein